MLHEFLSKNRNDLLERCRLKAAKRFDPPSAVRSVFTQGVPLFVEQLINALRVEALTPVKDRTELAPKPTPAPTEIGRTAAFQGLQMLRLGYTVDQVVHCYGDICQSVTELATERAELITTDEFRTLNGCLDNAIADAVTVYGSDRIAVNSRAEAINQLLGAYSNEQERLLDTAITSFNALQSGELGCSGATGTAHLNCLLELRSLSDRSLSAIRLASATGTITFGAESARSPDVGCEAQESFSTAAPRLGIEPA
jgi:hypothetical protein